MSRRKFLAGSIGAVGAVGGVGRAAVGPRRVGRKLGLIHSADVQVAASGWPVVERTLDSKAMKGDVRVCAASPALWTTADEPAGDTFDSPEDYKAHDVYANAAALSSLKVRIDCGAAEFPVERLESAVALRRAYGFHDAEQVVGELDRRAQFSSEAMAQTEAISPITAMNRLRRTGARGRSPSFSAAGGRTTASTLPTNMAPPMASTRKGRRSLPRNT